MTKFKASVLAVMGLLLVTIVISLIGPERALAAIGFTPVRDVDNPGRQPFSAHLDFGANFPNPARFNVPSRKRLVITYVDARAEDAVLADAIEIRSTVNGQTSSLLPPFATERATAIYLAQPVMGFADPETEVSVTYLVAGISNRPGASVNIHGYYNDIP